MGHREDKKAKKRTDKYKKPEMIHEDEMKKHKNKNAIGSTIG
ncbi:hypothetical protein [Clostridium sp.]